mmetsp:Transcript_13557/g.42788  ORF Transcript_13557/g.42788 Transcript_13557/m.42788 type:complete len:262 (+) Transcript_13557:279-1064(+)|eukprot:CAMPEP_0197388234 /NCGR_PEP_ID=MMETSP1165-20131217/960_1 /TAXON_ID=284809 /ORGANISM="Chrysocystis fragilis, Strain CCMP3189" /LENGTH=261 /DNA_ID=CAMNT_0042913577 /DNA_START=720 /DNA_END=1505 /DNA_ORIENTATION=-
MDDGGSLKEVELAKRGVDAFVDRANELHHQGRHTEALKQLERARRLCEKKLGPMHISTVKVLFILSSMRGPDGCKRGPTDANLHFVRFDLSPTDIACRGYYELVRILRRRIFVDELGVQLNVEFDKFDPSSRHILGLLGDAPVSYARWRLDGQVAVIDRLCTLQGYRNRSVGRRCLENVAHDVLSTTAQLQTSFEYMVLLVPRNEGLLQQKLADANFVPVAEYKDQHIPSVQMCLPISVLTTYIPTPLPQKRLFDQEYTGL